MRKLLIVFLCLISSMPMLFAQTQDGSHVKHIVSVPVNGASSLSIPLPVIPADQKKYVKSAVVLIRLKSGQYHQFSNIPFNYQLDFSAAPSAWFDQSTYALSVSDYKATDAIFKNIASFADNNGIFYNGATPVTQITLNSFSFGGSSSVPALDIDDSIRIEIEYDIEYGIDIYRQSLTSVLADAPSGLAINVTGKTATFSWNSGAYNYPDYQVQLLRVFNISEDSVTDEQYINARVDWSRALTLETESNATSLSLTIAEGQGYYFWRVRPVGTYYEGGIANSKNYSDAQWSTHQANAVLNITPSYDASNVHCFFFTDPDDHYNSIYSRVFTEGNRISENISYADGLLNSRQSQAHLPSKDTTIIVQNVLDNSGRVTLSTLPVPVSGQLNGYKNNFVLSDSTGTAYNADHFDTDQQYRNPNKIKQNGTDFKYYSDQNTNLQIPDAEGYAYTRILYYDDGTNRVKEQSGPGRMHALGDSSISGKGAGKTVKVYYEVPTQTELIRLFGAEAPDAQSVLKTITVDANNTASITYTSKEGYVIATSLAIMENDNAGSGKPFDQLQYEPSAFQIIDSTTANQVSNHAVVSSKRLVFLKPTTIDLSYAITCKTLDEACVSVDVDCGFEVNVMIHNLDHPAEDTLLSQISLDSACVDGYKTASWGSFTLNAGSYIIEKRLIATADPVAHARLAEEKVSKQISPLTDMIKGWVSTARCPERIQELYDTLAVLAADMDMLSDDALDDKYRAGLGLSPTDSFFTPLHDVNITYLGATPINLQITSPCCTLNIPIDLSPGISCDSILIRDLDSNDTLEVNKDYFNHPELSEVLPDFEGYAIGILMSCPSIETAEEAQDTLQKYMNGWRPGEFNLMVYHMLTDRYSCDGNMINENNQFVVNYASRPDTIYLSPGTVTPCGDTIQAGQTILPDCITGACRYYKCEDLIKCWTGLVEDLLLSVCSDVYLDADMQGGNISNEFDGNNDGNQSVHDNHFDNFQAPFLVKWLAKKKLSRRMRDLQASGGGGIAPGPTGYKKHMVYEFLTCTGFQFAKILNPRSPYPLSADSAAMVYAVPNSNTTAPPLEDRGYIPDSTWKAYSYVDLNPDGSPKTDAENIFPHIYDPVYAFKYFEYEEDQPRLESAVCYSDPNDCWDTTTVPGVWTRVPCCYDGISTAFCDKVRVSVYPNIDSTWVNDGSDTALYKYVVKQFCATGRRYCPITSRDWTCGQRAAYYQMLKSNRAVPDSFYVEQPYTCTQLTVTDYVDLSPAPVDESEYDHDDGTFVEIQVSNLMAQCNSRCDERRTEFEDELRGLLTSRCYVIGGCKQSQDDNIIPLPVFNALVDSMVANCHRQCVVKTYACTTSECRQLHESKFHLGYSLTGEEPFVDSYLEIGVGGGSGESTTVGANGLIDCTSDPTHSYCEKNKVDQAMNWDFELEIESKCDEEHIPGFTYTDTTIDCQPALPAGLNSANTGVLPDPNSTTQIPNQQYSNGIQIQTGP